MWIGKWQPFCLDLNALIYKRQFGINVTDGMSPCRQLATRLTQETNRYIVTSCKAKTGTHPSIHHKCHLNCDKIDRRDPSMTH